MGYGLRERVKKRLKLKEAAYKKGSPELDLILDNIVSTLDKKGVKHSSSVVGDHIVISTDNPEVVSEILYKMQSLGKITGYVNELKNEVLFIPDDDHTINESRKNRMSESSDELYCAEASEAIQEVYDFLKLNLPTWIDPSELELELTFPGNNKGIVIKGECVEENGIGATLKVLKDAVKNTITMTSIGENAGFTTNNGSECSIEFDDNGDDAVYLGVWL